MQQHASAGLFPCKADPAALPTPNRPCTCFLTWPSPMVSHPTIHALVPCWLLIQPANETDHESPTYSSQTPHALCWPNDDILLPSIRALCPGTLCRISQTVPGHATTALTAGPLMQAAPNQQLQNSKPIPQSFLLLSFSSALPQSFVPIPHIPSAERFDAGLHPD